MVKAAQSYIKDIRERYQAHKKNPDDIKKENQLNYSVREFAKRVEVEVFAANNEGQGYQRTPEEIGYKISPMKRYDKKNYPYYQFGDYQAYIELIGWYGVVIERKTLNDLYSTLIEDDHRKNLYQEIQRFKNDPRFSENGIFRMELECTEEEFKAYFPPFPKNCNFCNKQKIKLDTGDMWCPEAMFLYSPDEKFKGFYCPANSYEIKRRTPEDIEAINKKKETCLSRLIGKGVQLCWRGDRETANEKYKIDLQSWIIENYVRLLRLEEYDDRTYLLRKKAFIS